MGHASNVMFQSSQSVAVICGCHEIIEDIGDMGSSAAGNLSSIKSFILKCMYKHSRIQNMEEILLLPVISKTKVSRRFQAAIPERSKNPLPRRNAAEEPLGNICHHSGSLPFCAQCACYLHIAERRSMGDGDCLRYF